MYVEILQHSDKRFLDQNGLLGGLSFQGSVLGKSGIFGPRKMATISFRDSWYHEGLNLTLQLKTSYLLIHKSELTFLMNMLRADRKDTAKTITVLFQCHKDVVT